MLTKKGYLVAGVVAVLLAIAVFCTAGGGGSAILGRIQSLINDNQRTSQSINSAKDDIGAVSAGLGNTASELGESATALGESATAAGGYAKVAGDIADQSGKSGSLADECLRLNKQARLILETAKQRSESGTAKASN